MHKGKLLQKKGPAAKSLNLKLLPASDAELKAAIGEEVPEGYIAGWASTPDLDSYRDVVLPGAFSLSIAQRGLSGPKGIKLLLNHKWSQVAGVIKVLEYRGESLWIEAQLNLEISYSKDVYEAIKSAGGLSFSVGFFLQEYNIRQDAQGRDYFELVKGDLFEVSVVPFPANDAAIMEFFKSQEIEYEEFSSSETDPEAQMTLAEFEKMLVSTGLVKSRNDARLITLEVKEHKHLFFRNKAEAEPAEPEGEQQQGDEAPVAEKGLQNVLTSIEKLRSAFTPKTAT